jgi:hypothetical protein
MVMSIVQRLEKIQDEKETPESVATLTRCNVTNNAICIEARMFACDPATHEQILHGSDYQVEERFRTKEVLQFLSDVATAAMDYTLDLDSTAGEDSTIWKLARHGTLTYSVSSTKDGRVSVSLVMNHKLFMDMVNSAASIAIDELMKGAK